jgi:hypothetical protein
MMSWIVLLDKYDDTTIVKALSGIPAYTQWHTACETYINRHNGKNILLINYNHPLSPNKRPIRSLLALLPSQNEPLSPMIALSRFPSRRIRRSWSTTSTDLACSSPSANHPWYAIIEEEEPWEIAQSGASNSDAFPDRHLIDAQISSEQQVCISQTFSTRQCA